MFKTCNGCGQSKPFSDFYPKSGRPSKYADRPSGYEHVCKPCFRMERAEYVKNNPDKVKALYKARYDRNPDSYRDSNYRQKFGITLNQYNELFASQNGCCASCKRHQTELKKRLAVDHDHATGEIRGLLCQSCNRCLGFAQDSLRVLYSLIKYLLIRNPMLAAINSSVVSIRTSKKVG